MTRQNALSEALTLARNFASDLEDASRRFRFLIRDRDTKFTASFDEVFASIGVETIRTQIRSPRANAYAERFVRTIRQECLDRMRILGRRHLEGVLAEYVEHYNPHRPYRSLGQRSPSALDATPAPIDDIQPATLRGTDRLGGLIHEYRVAA